MTPPEREPRAAGSAEDAAGRECAALLAGMTVTTAVREQALALILADSFSRMDLVRAFPGRFGEQTRMIGERNAAIRRLLADDALIAQYDANAASLEGRRARGEAIHPAASGSPEGA